MGSLAVEPEVGAVVGAVEVNGGYNVVAELLGESNDHRSFDGIVENGIIAGWLKRVMMLGVFVVLGVFGALLFFHVGACYCSEVA